MIVSAKLYGTAHLNSHVQLQSFNCIAHCTESGDCSIGQMGKRDLASNPETTVVILNRAIVPCAI